MTTQLNRRQAIAGVGTIAGAAVITQAVVKIARAETDADAELHRLWHQYVEADVALSYANTYHDGVRVRCMREAQSMWYAEGVSRNLMDTTGRAFHGIFSRNDNGKAVEFAMPLDATDFDGAKAEMERAVKHTRKEHEKHFAENAKHYRLKKAYRAYDTCLARMEKAHAAIVNLPASTLHGAAIKLAADLIFRDEDSEDIPAVFALYRDLTKIIGHDYVADAERRMNAASKKGYADAAALPGLRVGPVSRKAVTA